MQARGRRWTSVTASSRRRSGRGERLMHGDAELVERIVVLTAEGHAVGEDDDGEVDRWIDPEARAGESGVTVGVEREIAAAHWPVRGAQGKTEAPADVVARNLFGARERRQLVADHRAVAEYARKRGHVGRRAEKARVPQTPPTANAFSSWTSPRKRLRRHSRSSSVAAHRSGGRGPKAASAASTTPSTRARTRSAKAASPTRARPAVSMM